MKKNDIDPNEFLEFVHDIDISWLPKDKLLREELIKIKEKKLIEEISSSEILEMIKNGTITEGMIPKINTCLDAVNNGVTAVGIIDGREKHSILFEIFSDKGSGTLIRK